MEYSLRSNDPSLFKHDIKQSTIHSALERPGISDKAAVAILVLGIIVSQAAFFVIIRASTRPQCFGFCPSAAVSITSSSCTQSGQDMLCTLIALNPGDNDVNAEGCTITAAGTSTVGHIGGTTLLAAGSSSSLTCTASGTGPTSGTAYTGSIELSNGASVPFAGTWS